MSSPTNHALRIVSAGNASIQEAALPKLRDDYILVKVKAVALNPTDWKHIDFLPSPGALTGCDYAGTAVEVGPKVTQEFKKGDRIAGMAHGGNAVEHEDGAFAEYIVVKGDLQIKIPDNLSFEEAATLGVGITTIGQSMYQALKLPLPKTPSSKEVKFLVIYGASTATGSLAIQYAKLSGLTAIGICSPGNFDYVKSLGADAVYDYNSPTCSQEIKDFTKDSVTYALDCISQGDSLRITVAAMSSSAGGVYATLLPVKADDVKKVNPNVEVKDTLAYTAFGEYFSFPNRKFEASHEDFEFAKGFWELSRGLLAEGAIKVHRPSVDKQEYGKGLEGVLKGLDAMRQGKVSGEKLVFTLP